MVRIGLHKLTGNKIAMKIYKKHKLIDINRKKSVWWEIKLMQKIKNPYIVDMIEAIDT